ncbi:MAG: acetylserotonin O-methyltransferase [Nitrospirota bacterium]
MAQQDEVISPEPVLSTVFAFWTSSILRTGVDFDVFTHISEGRKTADEIARASGANPGAIGRLLNALTGLKFLQKPDKDTYELTPVAAAYLVNNSPSYLGILTGHVTDLWNTWGRLTEVVRTGNLADMPTDMPTDMIDTPQKGPEFFKKLVARIFPLSYGIACRLADEIGAAGELKIVDVAAGAAPWSIPFAQKDKNISVTAVDFPEVLEMTKGYVERFNVASQYSYLAGNIRELNFGADTYDIALLGHICHSEGEVHSKELLKKIYRCLKPGGKVIIPEMVPDAERSAKTFPLMFSLNMLLHTSDGDTFLFEDYQAWLGAAGFRHIGIQIEEGAVTIITAVK